MSNRLIFSLLFFVAFLSPNFVTAFPFGEGPGGGTVLTPMTPLNVRVPTTNTSGSYTLTWSASAGLTMGNYRIQESFNNGSYTSIGTAAKSVTSYSLSGKQGGVYKYRVKACNVVTTTGTFKCSGWGYSGSLSVSSVPSTPATPTGQSSNDNGSYTISWTKPSGTVTAYTLQERLNSGSWVTITSSSSATSKSLSGKVNGIYDYKVKACNSGGCSGYSGYKRVTVQIDGGDLIPDQALILPNVPAQQNVGALEGQAGVSGGAANYSVPIAMPPGRAGMQPSVSLNYSSRNGNGVAGVGWSLSAGSSIHRCGQIAAIDDQGFGVTYSAAQDKLCLDGKRLIVTASSYGASGAVYRTELDSFVRVTQSGSINSSSSSFKVEHKNGRVSTYQGVGTANGRSENLKWMITKEADRAQNNIIYRYNTYAAGEHLLKSIDYTGYSSSAGNRHVEFHYDSTRPDKSVSYLAGGKTTHTMRLNKIKTLMGSKTVREYKLAFSTSSTSKRSILQSIQECAFDSASNSTCLKPTTLLSHTPQLSWDTVDSSDVNQSQIPSIGAMEGTDKIEMKDLNGDGIAEMLYLEREKISEGVYNFDVTVSKLKNGNYFEVANITNNYLATQVYGGIEGDINNDGITDFSANDNGELVYLQFDNDFVLKEYRTNFFFTAGFDRYNRGQGVQLIDIDADGYQDIVFTKLGIAGTVNVAYYRNLANGTINFSAPRTLHSQGGFPGSSLSSVAVSLMDLNGDGLQDLFLSYENTTLWVGFSKRNSQGFLDVDILTAADMGLPSGNNYNQYVWADLNGDGLKDFVRAEKNSGVYEWVFQANKGNRQFGSPQSLGNGLGIHEWPVSSNDSPYKRVQSKFGAINVADIDGDGIDELLVPTVSDDNLCVTFTGFLVDFGHDSFFRDCGDDIHLPEHRNQEDYAKKMYHMDMGLFDLRRFHWSILDFKVTSVGSSEQVKWSRTIADVAYAPINSAGLLDGRYYPGDQKTETNLSVFSSLKLVDYDNDGYQDFHFQTLARYGYQGDFELGGGVRILNGARVASFTGAKPATGFFIQKNLATNNTRQQDTLYRATDGLGNVNRWDYAPISRAESVNGKVLYSVPENRENWYSQQDPKREHFYFTSSMPVVTKFTQPNGIGGENSSTYRYSEAIYNRKGRGFQGFRNIVVDSPNGIRSSSDFHQIFPHAGQIETIRSCLFDDGEACENNFLTQTQMGYKAFDTTGRGTWWSVLGKTISTTNELNERERTNQTISYVGTSDPGSSPSDLANINFSLTTNEKTYGNINKSTQLIDGGFGIQKVSTVNQFDYAHTTYWWTNKLVKSDVTTQKLNVSGAEPSVYDTNLDNVKTVTTSINSYDSKGSRQPSNIKTTPSTGQAVTVATTYSDYGLPTSITTSSSGEANRQVNTTYSSDNYFVASVTNDKGHTVLSETHPEHGQNKWVKDANNQKTEYNYDVFGRVQRVTPPIGTGQAVHSRFAWCNGNCEGIDNAVYKVTSYSAGAPESTVFKDAFNRPLVSKTRQFSDAAVYRFSKYNALGQTTFESIATTSLYETDGTYFNSFDAIGRLTNKTVTQTNNQTLNVSYYYGDGNQYRTRIKVNSQPDMYRTYSGTGQLMQTTDSKSGVTRYAYDGSGNPIVMQDAKGNPIKATYNALGQKSWVDDPNMGKKTFTYTGYGEVETEKDANSDTTQYAYDSLGRLQKRYVNTKLEATFAYDLNSCLGTLSKETINRSNENYERTHAYDNYCRAASNTSAIDGDKYQVDLHYDGNYGRVKGKTYPNGLTVAYQYNNRGYLDITKNAQTGIIYRDIDLTDLQGNWTRAYQSNGKITINRSYHDETGQMKSTELRKGNSSGTIQQLINYKNYNALGNLTAMSAGNRIAGTYYLDEETYGYDSLNRLTNSRQTNVGGLINNYYYDYDSVGNFIYKGDFSVSSNNYLYGNKNKNIGGNAGPNAARRVSLANNKGYRYYNYDNNGNMTNDGTRAYLYNEFNKPTQITTSSNQRINPYDTKLTSSNTIEFAYGADQMRYKQTKTKSGVKTTTIYIDKMYEQITTGSNVETKTYIDDIAVVTHVGTATPKTNYIHRDRLGSMIASVDDNGNLLRSHSYDPFGKPRDGRLRDSKTTSSISTNILNQLDGSSTIVTNRGFTDHEHLDDAQIIHMNGRIYDYNLGRFLSVDPFIQAPGNSQSMNPYSYIMNNPLAGTDPSGYFARVIDDGVNQVSVSDEDYAGMQDFLSKNDGNAEFGFDDGVKINYSKSNGVSITLPSGNGEISNIPIEKIGEADDIAGATSESGSKSSSGGLGGLVRGVGSFAASLLPFGESAQMAMRGNWSGAFQSAAIEAGMMVAGAATGGLAYVAYKAYKTSKTARVLHKAFTGGTKRRKSPCPLSCFVAGTEVLTKDGYKNIEDIKEGDVVWAKNVETGESEWKPVTHTWIVENKDIYQVSIVGEDGKLQTIDATASHPFYVEGKGWVKTVDLVRGDSLVDKEEGILKVVSIVDEQRKDTAYNFTVADFHTYYVTERNILVHNCNGAKYGPNDPPVRIDGDWSVNDMKAALLGHPPKGLGKPDLHHADQMPGSGIHEILPGPHRGNKSLHQNKYNQGVTPGMRKADKELHWWYRAREQGADDILPDWIYD